MVHICYVFSFQCQDKLVKRNGKLENWATKKGHFTCRIFVGANWCDSQAKQSTGNCKTGTELDHDYNVDYYDNKDGPLFKEGFFKDSQYCRTYPLGYGNGWQQMWGNDESFFGSNLETSTDYGLGLDSDDNRDETGMTSREACCGCGGGNRNPDTFVESQDFPIYSNSPNFELTYPSEYRQVKHIRTTRCFLCSFVHAPLLAT